jgi:16S rRNA (cytidine1402-2'-O)-methyltransferase
MDTDRPRSQIRPRNLGARHYNVAAQALKAPDLAPGLHIVATPIGNLRDISLRALEILAAADFIACEDTRVTRRLLEHYGISTKLTRYDEYSAESSRPRILAALAEGAAVALVSDAGTPLISDPGYKLVRAAQEAGHLVAGAPGPSAVLTALAISGLPTDRFLFDGFLPAKSSQRRTRLEELKGIPATLVLFETGPRLAAALAELASILGPREAAICRELTKLHEEVRRGDLAELAAAYAEAPAPRGEIVLVIDSGPRIREPIEPGAVDTLLREALTRSSLKQAVDEVTAVAGRPRREIYRLALALKDESENGRS